MIAGLPPLAGFIGKVAMMRAQVAVGDPAAWTIVAILALSSLASVIGLTRLGVAAIWTRDENAPPLVVGTAEFVGILGLLGACVLMSVLGEPVLAYAEHTATWLADPSGYINAVLPGAGR